MRFECMIHGSKSTSAEKWICRACASAEFAKRDAHIAALESDRAAAYERGAREFAEMLTNEGIMLDYGSSVGREAPTDALARFLASRGTAEK